MIKVVIHETGKRNPKEEKSICFNRETHLFGSKEEAIEFLMERYDKTEKQLKKIMRKEYNHIYIDDDEGKSHAVGFSYSFWNRDISHSSKSWFQTNYIEIWNVTEKPIFEEMIE